MLAKDPAQRPDVARIAEVIEGVLDPMMRPTTPHVAQRESVTSIAKTVRRPRTRTMPWWLVVLIVALGAAGAFALIRGLAG
jgi:hypothetical protein